MLKSKYKKIVTVISAMTLAFAAGAQTTVIGSFQSSSDGNNGTYWQDAATGKAIGSDSPNATFPPAVVPGYGNSLEMNPEGATGYTPQIQGILTPAEITNFNNDAYITITLSVPTVTNGVNITSGYYQLVNLYVQKGAGGGYGDYHNLISGSGWNGLTQFEPNTPGDTASTNSNSSGMANFYFYAGSESEFSEVVTIKYSSFLSTDAALEGDTTNGLILGFQFNQAEGSPVYINNVVLSPGPFGSLAPTEPIGKFIVDNFSASGVSSSNPTNDDYFSSAQNYAAGDITNVWVDNFGIPTTNSWAGGVSPSYAATAGSLEIQWVWNNTLAQYANQVAVWENGSKYGLNSSPIVGEPAYTNFSCDIMFPPGAAVGVDGTFGALQIGTYAPNGNGNGSGGGQDYFGGGNYFVTVAGTNAGVWQHVSIPLNENDAAEVEGNMGAPIFHFQSSYTDPTINGPSTLYVDNIQFSGPGVVVTIPPPVITGPIPAVPGLRIFAGSSANTFDRASVGTVSQSESWINNNNTYPVTYSFSLLSYPNDNINQTMAQIVPITPLTESNNAYLNGNEFADYQDRDGMWLVLGPGPTAGSVVASVEWKTNLPNANPNQMALTFTNPTAIGTWTWTFTGTNTGTVTAPGNVPQSFTVTDATVTADFANPCGAIFGLQPNSGAGEGLFEDWGMIAIAGTGGSVTDDWTHQTADFSSGTSPDNNFSAEGSANPAGIVITRNGKDAYWFNWPNTVPTIGFGVVESTNLLVPPNQWIDPPWYNNNSDFSPPRADDSVLMANKYWTLMPYADLPTANGQQQVPQANPPYITVPLSPNAFWIGTTNYNNQYP